MKVDHGDDCAITCYYCSYLIIRNRHVIRCYRYVSFMVNDCLAFLCHIAYTCSFLKLLHGS